MDIKVIGSSCEKCTRLYDNTVAALKELYLDEQVEKVEELLDIVRLGVMTTPALMVDGKVHGLGRVLKTEEIIDILQK